MNNKISVIITCYNSESTLPLTIDSILDQSYKNLEIIIVNDGSDGNFNSIMNTYKNNNIRYVIHQSNRGLFAARISGIEHANGDYIAFVDADDTVSFDFYRTLVTAAEKENADIAIADTALKYSDVDIRYMNYDPLLMADISLEDKEVFRFFMDQRGLCFTFYVVWNKLYKRTLIDACLEELKTFSTSAGNITMCEDIAFSSLFWLKAKRVVNVHNIYYLYSQHDDQETKRELSQAVYLDKLTQVGKVFSFFGRNIGRYAELSAYHDQLDEWKALYARMWFQKAKSLNFEKEMRPFISQILSSDRIDEAVPQDSFMGSTQTQMARQFKGDETIKRMICSQETEYISFDIFDTLLLRPLYQPQDVFSLMTQAVNRMLGASSYIDFRSLRISCEQECRSENARKYGIEDISLDEIYAFMANKLNLSHTIVDQIKDLELETEEKLLTARGLGKDFYELARYANKKVICISDMYLPSDFVRRQLERNGFDQIEDIFVSSDARLLKGTGNLYREALRRLDVSNPRAIIHIGDNWRGDCDAAWKTGINAGYLPNCVERLKNLNPHFPSGDTIKNLTGGAGYRFNIKPGIENFIGTHVMLGLIANKRFGSSNLPFNPNSDFNGNPYFIGYFALGMHLYALCDWLKGQTKPGSTIHFIARDGYLPMKAMQIHSPEINTNYLYFSRKVIAPYLISNELDTVALLTFIRWQAVSPARIYDLFRYVANCDEDSFIKRSSELKFPPFRKFSGEAQFIEFLRLFFKEFIDCEKSGAAREILRQDLDELISEDDLLFDLGYSGRNEELFSRLLGRKINSAYIHINAATAARRLDLSNAEIRTFYDTSPTMFVLLRELLFSESGPSCIAYDSAAGSIRNVFEPWKPSFQQNFFISEIQRGALDFVRDFTKLNNDFEGRLYYRLHDASTPYEYFLHCAREVDRNLFSAWTFEDDLYGGVRLNVADYWAKLQNEHEKPAETKNEVTALNTQLNELRNSYASLEKKNKRLERSSFDNEAREKGFQDELDKRWILLNLLYHYVGNKSGFTLENLMQANPAEIAKRFALTPPPDFDEEAYCARYPDVGRLVEAGELPSAYLHYVTFGRAENRVR